MTQYKVVHFTDFGDGPIGFDIEPRLNVLQRQQFEEWMATEIRGTIFDSPEDMRIAVQRLLDRLSQ